MRPKLFQGWELQRPDSARERWSQCPWNNVETHFGGNVGKKYLKTRPSDCRSVTASRELLSVQRDISLLEMWHDPSGHPAGPCGLLPAALSKAFQVPYCPQYYRISSHQLAYPRHLHERQASSIFHLCSCWAQMDSWAEPSKGKIKLSNLQTARKNLPKIPHLLSTVSMSLSVYHLYPTCWKCFVCFVSRRRLTGDWI